MKIKIKIKNLSRNLHPFKEIIFTISSYLDVDVPGFWTMWKTSGASRQALVI